MVYLLQEQVIKFQDTTIGDLLIGVYTFITFVFSYWFAERHLTKKEQRAAQELYEHDLKLMPPAPLKRPLSGSKLTKSVVKYKAKKFKEAVEEGLIVEGTEEFEKRKTELLNDIQAVKAKTKKRTTKKSQNQ